MAGSIYASQQNEFLEPMAVERELAMGYEAGTTAAPDIEEGERCSALGQAIDLNALHSLFAVARELQRKAPPAATVAAVPAPAAEIAAVGEKRPAKKNYIFKCVNYIMLSIIRI